MVVGKLQNLRTIRYYNSAANFLTTKRQPKSFFDVGSLCQLRREVKKLECGDARVRFAVLASLVRGCCDLEALSEGKRLHSLIAATKYAQDTFLGNLLIRMYSKCGRMDLARAVFDKLPSKDLYSWNSIISAYSLSGQNAQSLEIFQKMKQESVAPDKVTFATIINACADPALVDYGRQIHAQAVEEGSEADVYVCTALINMYRESGETEKAYEAFAKCPRKNVIAWTAMAGAYVEAGEDAAALNLFQQMRKEGTKPNKVSFLTALSACNSPKTLAEGKLIHSLTVDFNLESDIMIATALVDMYGKCGSPYEACGLFSKMGDRNLVSWNAMIAAYAKNGLVELTLQLFCQMQQENLRLDSVTIVNMLDVFPSSKVVGDEDLHFYLASLEQEHELDVFVRTAIITVFVRRGNLKDARDFFDKMQFRNVLSWNAMIAAYVQNKCGRSALQLFKEMLRGDIKSDRLTYALSLYACADLSDLAEGRWVHDRAAKAGHSEDILTVNALIHMYAKCGSPSDALETFASIDRRNLLTWSALIAAHAHVGEAKSALKALGQMQWEGVSPDAIALLTLLSACSHAGLIDEGIHYFYSLGMAKISTEHYGCLIDLFARSGQLEEVKSVLTKMHAKPDAILCLTLLDAYRMHGDAELGNFAIQHLLESDPSVRGSEILIARGP